MSTLQKTPVHGEDDDLDDLDDIVDQFDSSNAPTAPSYSKASTSQSAGLPSSSNVDGACLDENMNDELSKALAGDMEALLREMSLSNPAMTSSAERERAAAFEKLLIDGMNGINDDGNAVASSSTTQAKMGPVPPPSAVDPLSEDAFQKSIKQAMEQLRKSDSELKSETSTVPPPGSDPLEALLSQLGANMDNLDESDGVLQGMLEEMMGQLMSKEVLYEPLKELHDKYPGYITENESKLTPEEKKRFSDQSACVSKVIAIFEEPGFQDGDPEKGAEIATLMNEMQSYGSPPSEIMGPLPPGLSFDQDGTNLPENCVIA